MSWNLTALKRALEPGGRTSGLIKGEVAGEPAEGLHPGFSASGQDVWLERAQFSGPGLVLSAVGARCGKVFEASGEWGTVANTVVLLPRPGYDSHFLWYLVNNEVFWEKGGAAQPYVRVAETLERRLLLPPLDHQSAIADYLDQETARIDALIDSKSRLVELLQARIEAVIESSIRRLVEQYGSTPLKYAVKRVEVGIVITPSNWYGDERGVSALRGLNIRSGSIDLADLVHLTEEGHELHRKSILRRGDLVVVRTGQAGAAAIVPPELDGCNCIDLVIVRPSRKVVPEFLELVLNSDWTQKHVEEYSVGTIQSHFNVGAMKQVPIPLPPTTHQTRVVEELVAERAAGNELEARLASQIDLLQEHRQALITAAVTGELDVPGVAA